MMNIFRIRHQDNFPCKYTTFFNIYISIVKFKVLIGESQQFGDNSIWLKQTLICRWLLACFSRIKRLQFELSKYLRKAYPFNRKGFVI